MSETGDQREMAMMFFRQDKAYRKWQPLRRQWEREATHLPEFSYADLPYVDLRNCNLSSLSFFGANLANANLSGADLTSADLRSANLRGADLRGTALSQCARNNARINRETFDRSGWNAVNLSEWYSAGASLDHDLYDLTQNGSTPLEPMPEKPRPEVRVFLCYRRTPVPSEFARELFEYLSARLGHEAVFLDDQHIDDGEDFVQHIRGHMRAYHVLVALIDKKWLIDPRSGRRRSPESADHVRSELEIALEGEMKVLPVLIDGADMPRVEELWPSIKGIANLNAVSISKKNFDESAERILGACAKLHYGKAHYA